MIKHEKIAALLRMTVDRGCTAAEAETARRLAAKLQAECARTAKIARRFDPPVTLDRHRSRKARQAQE
jgi:2'-5' RNA ligase